MADPQKYRLEARRLRLDAEVVNDAEVKNQMLTIAGQYERLAVSLEARTKDSRESRS
jgi:hypothetical protein